jgi:acetolactate synthase-1/2/3 large subunit
VRTTTGADRLLEALERHGVETIFGLPGTQGIEFWEALRRRPRLRTVVPTSELSASFMANGGARASGRAAALFTIPGPGFAYALAGVAEARLDSVPLLLVVPATARETDSRGGHESIDETTVVQPVAKSVVQASSADAVGAATVDALALAEAGEPGPVLLSVAGGAFAGPAPTPLPDPPRAEDADGAAVAARLAAAERPLLLVGQGAQGAAREVLELAERVSAPVVTTTSGRGVIPEDHPLAIPFDVPGAPVEALNALVDCADLVLALGCKLTYNGSIGGRRRLPPERLIRVDASADVVADGYPCSLGVVADCRRLVPQLLTVEPRSAWTEAEIASARAAVAASEPQLPEPTVAGGPAGALFAALRRAIPSDWPVVTDSGYHQYLVRHHHVVRAPRTFLVPSDFQSMGFGIAGAIGAAVSTAGSAVAVVGDGGFNIGATELLTAVREGLRLIVVVLVDGSFGLIRLHQLGRTGYESGVSIPLPDLGALSGSLGAEYRLVTDITSAEAAFHHAAAREGVTVVEVPVGDPPNLTAMRLRGRTASAVTSLAGPGVVSRLRGRARG